MLARSVDSIQPRDFDTVAASTCVCDCVMYVSFVICVKVCVSCMIKLRFVYIFFF
jgi:hypothetical protein